MYRNICNATVIILLILTMGCDNPVDSGSVSDLAPHTITYEPNGAYTGTIPTDSSRYDSGDTATIIANTGLLQRPALSFKSWNTHADGSGTEYAPGDTFLMPDSDVTLYAQWTIDMVTVPGGEFPQETISGSGSGISHSVTGFNIGRYEVTYDLWSYVYNWAIDNGYVFANAGSRGGYYQSGYFSYTDGHELHPVTNITWRDVIVWCNALSEMEGRTPVYYAQSSYIDELIFADPIRTSTNEAVDTTPGTQDNPYADWWWADGYRLPTEGEWQYAAAYEDGFSWSNGNYASGALHHYNDTFDGDSNGVPDGKDANDRVAVYRDYWDGEWLPTGVESSAIVGSKAANGLGIYDMSGNVTEYCWDWWDDYPASPQTNYRGPSAPPSGLYRVTRGGSWGVPASWITIGERYYKNTNKTPAVVYEDSGFRVAQRMLP